MEHKSNQEQCLNNPAANAKSFVLVFFIIIIYFSVLSLLVLQRDAAPEH